MSDELDAMATDIRMALANCEDGRWWGSGYEVLKDVPGGARIVARVTAVPGDTEDATRRFYNMEIMAKSRDWLSALLERAETAERQRDEFWQSLIAREDVEAERDVALSQLADARKAIQRVDAAWTDYIDDDANLDGIAEAIGALRAALPSEETPR